MNVKSDKSKLGAFTRRLTVLPALVAALSLALTGVASAQTTPFQATVTFTGTLPFEKAGGCSTGASICGTASIAGYGAASWNFYVLTFTDVQTPCGTTYQAITEFTLANDQNSTLVLDESGNLCGPGLDANGYFKEGPKAYGDPYTVVGAPSPSVPNGGWTVDPASTGKFEGLTGSGTDLVNVAGAHAAGSYSGTLG